MTGWVLTFVFSLCRAVVIEESLQHGFLWTPRLNSLLLHQPQKAPSLICPSQSTHLWWKPKATNTASLTFIFTITFLLPGWKKTLMSRKDVHTNMFSAPKLAVQTLILPFLVVRVITQTLSKYLWCHWLHQTPSCCGILAKVAHPLKLIFMVETGLISTLWTRWARAWMLLMFIYISKFQTHCNHSCTVMFKDMNNANMQKDKHLRATLYSTVHSTLFL